MYMYMCICNCIYTVYSMCICARYFFKTWTWHGHCWQVRGPGTVHFPGTDMTGGDDPCLPRCPRWFLHRKTPWVSQNIMVYSWWHHKSWWISIMIINGETIIKFNHNSIMMVSYLINNGVISTSSTSETETWLIAIYEIIRDYIIIESFWFNYIVAAQSACSFKAKLTHATGQFLASRCQKLVAFLRNMT